MQAQDPQDAEYVDSALKREKAGSVEFGVISMWVVAESTDKRFLFYHALIHRSIKLIFSNYFIPATLYGWLNITAVNKRQKF